MRSAACHARSRRISIDSPRNRTVPVAITIDGAIASCTAGLPFATASLDFTRDAGGAFLCASRHLSA
jgi:hypothetical protein